MYVSNYRCPVYTSGHEHRTHGSGWAYGTIEGGRGNGNSKFRFIVSPHCNLGYDVEAIYE